MERGQKYEDQDTNFCVTKKKMYENGLREMAKEKNKHGRVCERKEKIHRTM